MATYSNQTPLAQQMQFGVPQQPSMMQFPSYDGNSTGGINGAMSQFGQNFQGQNQAFNPMGMLGGGADMKTMPSFNLNGQGPAGGFGSNILGSLKEAGFGWNMPTAQLGLNGLQSLAGVVGGIASYRNANRQFEFAKGIANTNLNNQMQSYNDIVRDKSNRAAEFNGDSKESAQAEYERRKLTRSA